jgi:hypothetical protein
VGGDGAGVEEKESAAGAECVNSVSLLLWRSWHGAAVTDEVPLVERRDLTHRACRAVPPLQRRGDNAARLGKQKEIECFKK